MKKEEFDNLSNEKKIEILNRYIGKTKEFSIENDFSWSYATTHCQFTKNGNIYMPLNESEIQAEIERQEENKKKKELKEKAIYLFERKMNMKKEQKSKTKICIDNIYLEKLKKEEEETGLSKTELVNYALHKYFKDNSEGDEDE